MTILTFINKAFVELMLILNFVNVDNIIVRTFEADIIINVDIQVTFFTKYSIKYKVNFQKWPKMRHVGTISVRTRTLRGQVQILESPRLFPNVVSTGSTNFIINILKLYMGIFFRGTTHCQWATGQ